MNRWQILLIFVILREDFAGNENYLELILNSDVLSIMIILMNSDEI
jgi:hypothetical protein